MNLKFNKNETAILHEMCYIQIESYQDILANNELESEALLLYNKNSLADAIREAKWRIKKYKEVINNPENLIFLDDTEIMTLRHILFHLEDLYLETRPQLANSIMELWSKFFMIEEIMNKHLTNIKEVVIKNIEQHERTRNKREVTIK